MTTYRVQVRAWADTSTFGPGAIIAEFENPMNVGYADYINDVPEAFFTIQQDSRYAPLLRGYEGRSHVWIYRNDELVHQGLWLETDNSPDDIVIYSYGYLAALYWLHTDWAQEWTSAQVDTIITDLWNRAQTTHTQSNVGFVGDGTIEAAVTTSGGATPLVLPLYTTYYKRILFAMKELAAFSIGDTTNTVIFEIPPAASPVFNFWKNRGADKPDVRFEWGDKKIAWYADRKYGVWQRSELLAVGSSPNDILLRKSVTDSTVMTSIGRRQESIFLAWVRDDTELDRVMDLRLSKAVRNDTDLMLRLYPDSLDPAPASSAGYRMGDRVYVKIDRGLTNYDGYLRVIGTQALSSRGSENVRLMLQEQHGA